jgi:hypothetical protein
MNTPLKIPFLLMCAGVLLVCGSGQTSSGQTQSREPEQLVPGETAPPAEPGSKGFGSPVSNSQSRPTLAETPVPEIKTVSLDELNMSDPFILPDQATHKYYLTSSGGRIYTSSDLKMWTGPYPAFDVKGTWMEGTRGVAAAELHHINGKYYYVGTFRNGKELVDVVPRRYNVYRSTSQVLASEKPEGPYKLMNPDPDYGFLPRNWATLDGTLWYEGGTPYLVFVHEWVQAIDGTIEYVRLSPDLSSTISKPKCLFRASEAPWVLEMNGNKETTYGMKLPGWVTDAPQLFRTKTGKLGMLWSSWGEHRYAQGVAYSASGTIDGPWIQEKESLKGDNSGHGMLFTTFEGKRLLVIHHAEGDGPRKPQLYEIDDSGDKLVLGPRFNP